MPAVLRFTAPVELEAAAASPKGPRRFTTVAYTGGALRIAGYDRPVVVDLAGLTPRNGVSANLDHDPTKRVGHVDDVQNDGKSLTLAGVVSAANPAADEFTASHDRGYRWQASVEVAPRHLDSVGRSDTIAANGRTFTGPLYVTRKGELSAVAFVPNGADDFTSVTLAAHRKRGTVMSNFQNFLNKMVPGVSAGDMTPGQLAACHANFCGRNEVLPEDHAAVAPFIKAAADDPVEAESRRLRQIESAVKGDWADQADIVAELRGKAIQNELQIDELVERMRPIRADKWENKFPLAHAPAASRREAVNGDVIQAALCQAVNLPALEEHFDERTLQAAHTFHRGRIGLQQILLQAAAQNGYRLDPGTRISGGNIHAVLAAAFPPVHAAAFSTYSLPGILSNVANKSLLQGWSEGDLSWRQLAMVKPVSNFHQATSYRLLDSLEYEQVAPGGELAHGTVSEESYTRQAHTHGRMFSITRTDIINDDLGAFEDLRIRIGRGALAKFNRVFWSRFIDNSAFFHIDHGNVSTGAPGSVLGADGVGLQAAVLKFRKLVSPDGKSIDGEPAMLLVPPELEFNARRLYQSTNIVATGDADATLTSANVFGGLYRPIIQRRLSDAAFTGNSATAWYLLRSPSIAAVVVASFLNGQQNPTVETAQADFNTLGIQMRGYHDFGVDLTVDYLAGVRSAGA